MKLSRHQFLHLAAGATALPAISHVAQAQSYPTRPVRIIVSSTPGSGSDIEARYLSQWLSERLGRQFIVENRPGAGSNIGTEAVVRATPDGYTLLMVVPPNAINATLYEKLNYNFIRDIAPVAGLTRDPVVMEVPPSLPTKTVAEFIAYAKSSPGKINYASGGNGSIQHVTGELFKMMTSVNMLHVPYRGEGAAFTDLLSGQVQVMFGTITSSIGYIRAGTLRPLAVTTAIRLEALSDIPTVGDFVPGFEASNLRGVAAPKNTPVEIIDKLNKEINAFLADPKTKARFSDIGATVLPGSPADFGQLIVDETEKWAKVIKFAGIKAE
jgi:tripartite-type tricarboxylate transporter receptor subunit TctC